MNENKAFDVIKGMHASGLNPMQNHTRRNEEKNMESNGLPRGSPRIFSQCSDFPRISPFFRVHPGFGRIGLILILLCSSLSFFIQPVQAAEPVITSEDQLNFQATWTFTDAAEFNTTETEIADSEVFLTSHDFHWNQSTQSDFNSGTRTDLTLTRQSNTEVEWSDDFENPAGSGWDHGILTLGTDLWQHGLVSEIPDFIGSHGGGSFVWGTNLSGEYEDNSGIPGDYYLRSPGINLSESVNTKMSFWHFYTFDNATDYNDGGRVEISVDNGENWDPIFPVTGYDGTIKSPSSNPLEGQFCFAGNSSSWVEAAFDLSPHDGVENFLFRFRFATNGQNSDFGWYIDDIEITSTTFSDGEVELGTRIVEVGNDDVNFLQTPKDTTIIDINNPANFDGILTKWRVVIANASSEAKGVMKIFRTVGGGFMLVNQTDPVDITVGTNEFDCYMEIEEGDYIGWYGENAEIFGKSEGSSYSKPGNISQNLPISNWTEIDFTFSLRSWGISRFPDGEMISQLFDARSPARWQELSWTENISLPGTDIVFQTRSGNDTDTSDSSWSPWSSYLSNPAGSEIKSLPPAMYFQFKCLLSTTVQPNTPVLFQVGLKYSKYSISGEVETADLAPETVVQWQEFTAQENPMGQDIDYYYSLDSGSEWKPIPEDGDLTEISVLEGKIRFKVNLSTSDTTITPTLQEMSITFSSATPEMVIFIEADGTKAKPGDMVSFTIYYDNRGPGNAQNVEITLQLNENLRYRGDSSDIDPTVENENVRTWLFPSVEPGNRTFSVDTEVKEIEEKTVILTMASLNYTDLGGNPYDYEVSNTVPTVLSPHVDLFFYYLSIIGIIAAILIISILLIAHRIKKLRESEVHFGPDDVGKGIGHLVMEENPTISYGIFSDLIDQGSGGLLITRTFPGRVKDSYFFEGVSMLWLSRARDKDSILPTNLGGILRRAQDFMEANEESVVLLDGLEYLTVHNDFQKVLKLIHGLNEMAAIYNARFIMPLNPLALDPEKVALLKRDLKILA